MAPMPQVQLMPTGGVTIDYAADWLAAGASAVGIGSALLDKEVLARADYPALTDRARRLRETIATYRGSTSS